MTQELATSPVNNESLKRKVLESNDASVSAPVPVSVTTADLTATAPAAESSLPEEVESKKLKTSHAQDSTSSETAVDENDAAVEQDEEDDDADDVR